MRDDSSLWPMISRGAAGLQRASTRSWVATLRDCLRKCGDLSRSGLRSRRGWVDHDLTVANGNDFARVMVHVDLVALAIELVNDVIAGRFFAAVIGRDTALFRRSVGIAFLYLLLDLVTGITAGSSACQTGNNSRVATADAATQQAAYDCTDTRTHEPMLVFDRLCVSDFFVMTFLTRSLDRLGQRSGADNVGSARGRNHSITSHRARG